ncbi:tRNA glutamyl-Q(34) synthetase GluQRS [Marinicella rhabdoformis]|uniref:tRNA glutamyl-Q(34) synthetase GluQRS n=1 Tax=Marinicella rhabdoformis TaxID=2580566 RepID=UPI001FE624DF|nr:tRNA glutamyl-Q(34) synthetase GluQRS [Marinicella rhabdoformis]
MKDTPYRGRFAPSPSGNLHFGSLVAAIASYCQAKSHEGVWLLRIEDLDPPRAIPGADLAIIKELTRFNMVSDEPVIYQSHELQQHDYFKALEYLIDNKHCYPCLCTRKMLIQHDIYPNTCQNNLFPCTQEHAIKIKAPDQDFVFIDKIQGTQSQNIQKQCGDFNIRRKDGLICYQLAVVIDDAKQGITEVVRGIDILDSTGRQIFLQQTLNLTTPVYAHFPVLTYANGNKLSKQNHAKEIYGEDSYELTRMALQVLGQEPPKLTIKNQGHMLRWGIENWDIKKVPSVKEVTFDSETRLD